MALNGEANRKSGVYKNVCCGAEIVINAGSMFPDCTNHPHVITMWRRVVNEGIIGPARRKAGFQAGPEAHIENRRLFDLACGRIKLEDWEQNHLHQCRVCQGVLYVFVQQPTSTVPGSGEKRAEVA